MTTTSESTTGSFVSFHNDEAVKRKYLARVKHHRELDHLTQGVGWSAAWSAAESAAWSVRNEEVRVKRDWLLAELKSLKA